MYQIFKCRQLFPSPEPILKEACTDEDVIMKMPVVK